MRFIAFLMTTTLSLVWVPLTLSAGGPDAAENMVTKRNLAYGPHKAQRLDVYLPKNAKNAPVMIYIHGGGWAKGDKSRVGLKPAFFTGKGWIFVSINYRLLPDGRHPNNVEDVAAAIAWVHDRVEKHGGDPDAMFVMGHSAGCHLAALVATDRRPLQKAGKSLAILKGVIALDTQAYDVVALMNSPAKVYYQKVFGTDTKVHKDASPQLHLARGKNIPPFLICYSRGLGKRINPNRKSAAEGFAKALKAVGVRAKVVDASDRNHGQINQRFGDPKDERVTGQAITFLNSQIEVSAQKAAGNQNE